MVKNYLIVRKDGKNAYSTSIVAYQVIKNAPVKIGELHGASSQDTEIGYLERVFKKNDSKIDIREQWRDDKIVIHEIRM